MAAAKTTKRKKTAPPKPKRLYRSESDRMIAGVAGGLGDFFEVDSTLIRLLFVFLVVAGGSGILLYILLWLFIPTESAVAEYSEATFKKNAKEIGKKAEEMTTENTRRWIGVILLFLGVVLLFQRFGVFGFNIFRLWPLVLIGIGLAVLLRND